MDGKSKNRITVKIMGDEYTIKGTASRESMQKASRYVDQLMRDIVGKNGHMSRQKAAVLAAINLADELLRYQQGSQIYLENIRERGDEDELV